MTAPQLQGLIDTSSAALAAWNAALESISSLGGPNGEIFDLEKIIPNSSPQSTAKQIDAKLSGAIALIHTLSGIESAELIPDSLVNELTARVGQVRTVVDKFGQSLTEFGNDAEVNALDPVGLTATNSKGQQLNLPPLFSELYGVIQALLSPLYSIRAMAGLHQEQGFSYQISHLNAARSAQRRTYGDLNRVRKVAVKITKDLEASSEASAVSAKKIAELEAQATAATGKIDEEKNKATAHVAAISEVNANAAKLKETVGAYSNDFAKFQEDLSARNAAFEKGSADLKELLAELDAQREEVGRLQQRSREVLGEATVSGLSESFAREMKKSNWQLIRV